MSNHSQLVEELKSQSSKRPSRRSINAGAIAQSANKALAASQVASAEDALANSLAAADAQLAQVDKTSVDTLAHEIDAYGKTVDKKKPGVGGQSHKSGSRRQSATSRRGESPLRAGASL